MQTAWHLPASRTDRAFPPNTLASFEARFPLQIRCYTDALNLPRPRPFLGPESRVERSFLPDGKAAQTDTRTPADSNPRYTGPGHRLEPRFDTDFAIAAGSGANSARSWATSADYTDTSRCLLAPCA